MKVLMINGSTKKNGTTFRALNEVAKTLEGVGISSEIVSLGANPVRDCAGCNHCQSAEENQCIFGDDAVNDILEKARSADGFVFGSPVYYAQPTGQLLSVLHRLFYAGVDAFSFKPGAAVVTLRRAGATASLDALNKFFTNACMPVVSSTYWNELHGPAADIFCKVTLAVSVTVGNGTLTGSSAGMRSRGSGSQSSRYLRPSHPARSSLPQPSYP